MNVECLRIAEMIFLPKLQTDRPKKNRCARNNGRKTFLLAEME